VSEVALPRLTLPLTCSVPSTTVLPVAPATVNLFESTTKSVVTVRSFPTVTSLGNPTTTFTSVPTLVTAVSISLVVPSKCKDPY
jgi:hypothetical protein